MSNSHAWFAGLTVDHLYADCPNRVRAEPTLREYDLWNVGGSAIDPHQDFVCGMCLHRHGRVHRPSEATP